MQPVLKGENFSPKCVVPVPEPMQLQTGINAQISTSAGLSFVPFLEDTRFLGMEPIVPHYSFQISDTISRL
jgi:hypothetical protein